jgi:acyl-coenzyme A thioesterase PaaI-like protein
LENSGPIQKHVRDWNDTDFFRWSGLHLISAEDGDSRVELLVEKHHRGGGGSPNAINGGIVSYMFDGLLGAAVASTWDETTIGQATIALNVNFLDAIEAEARSP